MEGIFIPQYILLGRKIKNFNCFIKNHRIQNENSSQISKGFQALTLKFQKGEERFAFLKRKRDFFMNYDQLRPVFWN